MFKRNCGQLLHANAGICVSKAGPGHGGVQGGPHGPGSRPPRRPCRPVSASLRCCPQDFWEETQAPERGRMTATQGGTSEPRDGGSRPVSRGRVSSHPRPVLGHRRYVSSERPQTEWNSQCVLLGAVSPCSCAGHSTSCDGTFQNQRGMQEEPLGEASRGKWWPGQDGSLGVRWASASFLFLTTGLSSKAAVQTARPASCP